MSDRLIGDASDFYRLRVVRVDDADTMDLEWRDDILYRSPPVQDVEEYAVHRVEIVSKSSEDVVASLGEYTSVEEAEEIVEDAQTALDEMTKTQFDARFVQPE